MASPTKKTMDEKPDKASIKDLPATDDRDAAIKGGLKKSGETQKNYDPKANKEL
jgi:hypothetical protein